MDIIEYKTAYRYHWFYGGRGSGKSWGVVDIQLHDALQKPLQIMFFMKFQVKLEDGIWRLVLKTIERWGLIEGVHYTINKTNKKIHFKNGSYFAFSGMDNSEKSKGAEGFDRAVIEEVTQFTEEDFNAIDAVMRSKGAKIYAMHNPIPLQAGALHWTQRRFINLVAHDMGIIKPFEIDIDSDIKEKLKKLYPDKKIENPKGIILKSNYTHNDYADIDFIMMLEGLKKTNPDLYDMWVNGTFVEFKGAILKKGYTLVDSVPDDLDFIGYGLDFGFASDPAALIAIWKKGRRYCLKEIVYSQGLTDDELYSIMIAKGVNKNDRIIADNEPKAIALLKKLGLNNIRGCGKKPAYYKKPAAMYMQGCEFMIVKGSTNLQNEFSTWSWEINKDGDIKPSANVADGNDHLMDAFLYGDQLNKIVPGGNNKMMNVYM